MRRPGAAIAVLAAWIATISVGGRRGRV